VYLNSTEHEISFLNYYPTPWRDSISRPITPVSSVAGGDDTTRPLSCLLNILTNTRLAVDLLPDEMLLEVLDSESHQIRSKTNWPKHELEKAECVLVNLKRKKMYFN
jgi:hypothetical protein